MNYSSILRCMSLFGMYLCVFYCSLGFGQTGLTKSIRMNQVGYLPQCPKFAVVKVGRNKSFSKFSIKSVDRKRLYFEGQLRDSLYWDAARDTIKRADFTSFDVPGVYVIDVAGLGYSYPFEIKDVLYKNLNVDAIRYFYLNRASTSIPKVHGGIYARAAGHMDANVTVHSSAASATRPEGSKVNVPKGWYDAGDYGCYTTNTAISVYTLMLSYDVYQSYFDSLKLNIPEGGNTMPDILDEVKWCLDWLLSMQDPDDGGVYFKKVSLNFPPFIQPSQDVSERMVINKSTQSALDFAAVMAYASRLYRKHHAAYADQCLASAIKAYAWALANPSKLILRNTPDDYSGAYSDGNPNDELFWAKVELYITTKDDGYLPTIPSNFPVASWQNVGILGCYSLLHNKAILTDLGKGSLTMVENIVLNIATVRNSSYISSAYKTLILSGDFYWGSNSVHLNALLNHYFAYKILQKKEYLEAISHSFDYILGKNPLSLSFVTKYGVNSPTNPHHRISITSKIIPGMVVGGSNPRNTEDCADYYSFETSYGTRLAPLCYFDDICSYSTNETAINWNAPLVFVVTCLLNEYGCKDTTADYAKFKNMKVANDECNVLLSFEVENEGQNGSYVIERSFDNVTFTKLAEIANDRSGVYVYKDTDIGLKRVYYRVWSDTKLMDEVVYSHSSVQDVDFTPNYLNVYPIPVDDVLHIDIPCYTTANFKIHNSFGPLVASGNLTEAKSYLNLSGWPAGMYIATFEVNQKIYKRRIIVQ